MIENIYWTEKYRPSTLDDVIGNESIVSSLHQWADTGELPNLLLAGPAGTGKTALSTAFAKDYYGDSWKQNFLELNASDDRGIDVIRETIKGYAQQSSVGGYPFTVIFLDESDSLTKDAQAALRRVMEDYASDTRFIMSCNYPNKLIDPIQSRTTMFRVRPLQDRQIKRILQRVVEGEELETSGDVLDIIVEATNGDARKAINALQAASTGDEVSVSGLDGVISDVDESALQTLLTDAIGGNLHDAQQALNQDFLKQGVDTGTLASKTMRVLSGIDMPEDARVIAYDKLGECEYRVIDGANPHVQWSAFLANLHIARHITYNAYE